MDKNADEFNKKPNESGNGDAKRELSREERRRRNRIFNTVLYCISGTLILTGVLIILRDQTLLFDKARVFLGCTKVDIPDVTFPPEPFNDEIVINVPNPGTPAPTFYDPYATPAPTSLYTPEPTEAPSRPVSIYFEEHGISLSVQEVGINANGTMETIQAHDIAGWYKYGATPNSPGNCIIAAHNRYSGRKGLFSILHEGLAVGDRVLVRMENGAYAFYRVASIDIYKYDEAPPSVMQTDGEDRLTLITCLGDYDYNLHMSASRVVAVCEPVG